MSHIHLLSSKRKSIRQYAQQALSPESIQQIIEVGLRAPSACNRRATRFILVEDPEMLQRLSQARKHGSRFLADCALAIVVAVDLNKARRPEADCAVAAAMMQLCITDLELASCWCHIADCKRADDTDSEAYVKDLLHIPPSIGVLCILAVGVPKTDEDLAYRETALDWGRVSIGQFKEPEELATPTADDEDASEPSRCCKKKDRVDE